MKCVQGHVSPVVVGGVSVYIHSIQGFVAAHQPLWVYTVCTPTPSDPAGFFKEGGEVIKLYIDGSLMIPNIGI